MKIFFYLLFGVTFIINSCTIGQFGTVNDENKLSLQKKQIHLNDIDNEMQLNQSKIIKLSVDKDNIDKVLVPEIITDQSILAIDNSAPCKFTTNTPECFVKITAIKLGSTVLRVKLNGFKDEVSTNIKVSSLNFVLLGGYPGAIFTNIDGVINKSSGSIIDRVAYFKGLATDTKGHYVAIGDSGTILVSFDNGMNWKSPGDNVGLYNISFQDVVNDTKGHYVAVGSNGTIIVSSDNGINWVQVKNNEDITTTFLNGVTTDTQGHYVAVDRYGKIIVSSDNGMNWVQAANNGGVTTLNGVTTDRQGHYVAVGSNGKIIVSSDNGMNWVQATNNGVDTTLNGVTTDRQGHYVAVGSNGTILVSSDNGLNWQKINNSVCNDYLNQVIFDSISKNFIIIGNNKCMIRSYDNGNTWTSLLFMKEKIDINDFQGIAVI
jgi:photosystem II stability/assembly factor-like uncharacterized protein